MSAGFPFQEQSQMCPHDFVQCGRMHPCSVIPKQFIVECLLFYPGFLGLQVMMEEENYGITVDNCLLALENNGNLIMKNSYQYAFDFQNTALTTGLDADSPFLSLCVLLLLVNLQHLFRDVLAAALGTFPSLFSAVVKSKVTFCYQLGLLQIQWNSFPFLKVQKTFGSLNSIYFSNTMSKRWQRQEGGQIQAKSIEIDVHIYIG